MQPASADAPDRAKAGSIHRPQHRRLPAFSIFCFLQVLLESIGPFLLQIWNLRWKTIPTKTISIQHLDFIVLRVVGQPVVGKPMAQQSMPHATAAQATWIREAAAGGTWPSGQFKRGVGFKGGVAV